ncbi:SCP2 sterol-binding domain-containing protein [Nitrosopumilus sp.]|uniref:SCP2 sterol-binding domain-containing protein n=1 Tax=Nitrosopumilus sp. TaxID=2024843 RepID=UPI002930709B|nr:SCP2 sterol-binding domain-containing protein [Nitrosopumilus sp.]
MESQSEQYKKSRSNQKMSQQSTKKITGFREASSDVLRKICLEEGADDVGFVEIERKALGSVKKEALELYYKTKTIISFCVRTNPENIQSPSRSLASEEFHKTYADLSIIARRIVKRLNKVGIRAVACHPVFPMDMNRWASKIWEISHKPIAEQAGLGTTGINRMILHPKFGTFMLLDSILIDSEVDKYDQPLYYDPCIGCHLCIASCPVGALDVRKGVDFNACMTHNYRDFMGGFEDWIENIVDAKDSKEFRKKSSDSENVSRWQSLSYGPQYKAAYCISVCPAGEDLVSVYRNDRKGWVENILKPLSNKKEPIYVGKDTYAEEYARKNPNKEVKVIRNIFRPNSINGFLTGVRVAFEQKHARGVNMTVHFESNGMETTQATMIIAGEVIDVKEGHVGIADLGITADSETWLKTVNKETSSAEDIQAITSGKIKVQGDLKLLKQFQECFIGQE